MSKDTEPAAATQRAQQANSAAANSLSTTVGEYVGHVRHRQLVTAVGECEWPSEGDETDV